MDKEKYYSSKEIKEMLNIKKDKLRNLIRNNKLKCVIGDNGFFYFEKTYIDNLTEDEKYVLRNKNLKYIKGQVVNDFTIIDITEKRVADDGRNTIIREYKLKCNVCGMEKTVISGNVNRYSKHTDNCCRNNNVYCKELNVKYNSIKNRCENPNNKNYKYYGGKGVKLLFTYPEFYNKMYESYIKHVEEFGRENTTIDRIDTDGDYSLDNIRWATIKEQNQNKDLKTIAKKQSEVKLGFKIEELKEDYEKFINKETNYSEIAKKWNITRQTIRKIFIKYFGMDKDFNTRTKKYNLSKKENK